MDLSERGVAALAERFLSSHLWCQVLQVAARTRGLLPCISLNHTPVDTVGERELPKGLYTYVLTTDHGKLEIECVLTM